MTEFDFCFVIIKSDGLRKCSFLQPARKPRMLISYRLHHASTFLSGLRSEYFNPPRSALAEPSCNQLRDVPEKQLHFHTPKILLQQRRARMKALKALRG